MTVVLRKAYGGGIHHDELEGPGRRPRARLAGRRDRRDGRQAGRGRSSTARDIAAADDPDGRARPAGRASTRRSTCPPSVAAREGHIDELVEPADTRARLAGALAALSHGGRRQRWGEHPAVTIYVALGDRFTAGLEPASRAGRTSWRARSGRTVATRTWPRSAPRSEDVERSSSTARWRSSPTSSRSSAAPTTCCSRRGRTQTSTPSGCRACSGGCAARRPEPRS